MAQANRDILDSLSFSKFCASTEFTKVNMPVLDTTPDSASTVTPPALSFLKIQQWSICGLTSYQIYSGGHQIYSGVLNLIQGFSAPFSWLLLISAVCQIGSGVESLVQGLSRFKHWTKAGAQQHDDDTAVTLTVFSKAMAVRTTAFDSMHDWFRYI